MSLVEAGISWFFNVAVVINAVMVYLNLSKVWKKKHEVAVSRSVSVQGRMIGIVVATAFLLNFILKGDYGSSFSYTLFLLNDTIFFLVGVGFWARKRSF